LHTLDHPPATRSWRALATLYLATRPRDGGAPKFLGAFVWGRVLYHVVGGEMVMWFFFILFCRAFGELRAGTGTADCLLEMLIAPIHGDDTAAGDKNTRLGGTNTSPSSWSLLGAQRRRAPRKLVEGCHSRVRAGPARESTEAHCGASAKTLLE